MSDFDIAALRRVVLASGVNTVAQRCGVTPATIYGWLYGALTADERERAALMVLVDEAAEAFADRESEVPTLVNARTVPPPHRIRTVAIVDDDEDHRSFLRAILERHNYDVLEAHDGLDALDVLARHGTVPDLMLLDRSARRP